MHRLQISVFGAVAIVFAVDGTNAGIYAPMGARTAMGAGWLLLAIVDVIWVLYFTSEEDSLIFHVFNMLGTGGLTPPSRRRRTRASSMQHIPSVNGYPSNYASGGIGSHEFDQKVASGGFGSPQPGIRNQNSFGGSMTEGVRSLGGVTGPGSIHNQSIGGGGTSIGGGDNGPGSPLMAGIGAGSSSVTSTQHPDGLSSNQEAYAYKAKAMYACKWLCSPHELQS